MAEQRISIFRRFDMTPSKIKQAVILLLAVTCLLAAVPASAQVDKATVKINGMI